MELGDWKGFKKRRAEAQKRKRLRGIGLCNYLETTGGYPRERADITVQPHGKVDVVVGTLSSGQSHETTFAQCVAEWLGVPFDDVHVNESDTDIVKEGGGSHSARSMRLAGIVMGNASDAIIEKGKKIAAHMLETAEDDIGFAAGRFTVKGTDRSVGIFDVAGAAARRQKRAGGFARAARRHLRRNDPAARLSLWRPRLRGRDRSANRRARTRAATPRSTMSAAPSIRWSSTAKPMAAPRKGSARRCGSFAPTTRRDSLLVGVVHGLRHAARRSTCRPSPPISARCSRRPTGSACAAPAKAAPPARSAPWSMPWSTRSPNSASPISKCR